jgi:hypothetical protein
MTKDELMALAREGKASIEESLTYLVTRYRIEPVNAPETNAVLCVELSTYGIEDSFFTDGEVIMDLTSQDDDELHAVIDAFLAES